MAEHVIVEAGVGWNCTCGAWGWTADQAGQHVADAQVSKAERAVDESWERNRRVGT